jgi:hypothetical protein
MATVQGCAQWCDVVSLPSKLFLPIFCYLKTENSKIYCISVTDHISAFRPTNPRRARQIKLFFIAAYVQSPKVLTAGYLSTFSQ